jgi:hypothetical protein
VTLINWHGGLRTECAGMRGSVAGGVSKLTKLVVAWSLACRPLMRYKRNVDSRCRHWLGGSSPRTVLFDSPVSVRVLEMGGSTASDQSVLGFAPIICWTDLTSILRFYSPNEQTR